jgi:tetratricopeptide (TPR) repeat protein
VAAWFNHCEFENTDQPTRELLPGVVLNVQGRPVCSRALSLLLTPSFPVSEGDTIFCPGVLWFRQTARRVGDLVEVTLRANEDLVVRQVWRPGEFWWREATWEFRATLLVGFSAAGIDAYDVRGDPGDPPRQTFRLTARRLPDESLGTPSIAPDAIREGFNTVEFWGLDEVLFDPLAECLKHLLSPVDVSAYLGKLEAARHRQTCSYGRPSPRPEKPSLEQLAELAAQRLDPHSDEGIRANSLLADAFLAAGRFEEAAERYRHLDAARDQSEAKEWEIRHLLSRPFEGSWAQALVSLGRQEESVQLLRRTQQKRLLYTTEGLLLADTLFELKDYQAAAAAYAALPVTGNAVGARRLLREGLAWVGSATPSQRDGDTFRAQRAWRECVRFFSDLPEATEARSRADAQAEMDALLATRREEKPWEDFGLRAQWDYAASGLLEGGHITGQVVLDREGAPEILIQTYEGNKGYTCYAMDPTGRTLQPADKDRFQAAFDALRRPYQQALRKREVHRAEDFVLWQEAETLTLTAPDGQVRWSYTADTELDLQDQRADPGIPLLVGVTVTRLAGETVIVLGVQQRTVSIGMGLNYFPVSGDVRCLGLDGKERWRTKTVAGEEALVVAPPHSDQPMVYVLGKVPGPLLRWHVACVWECFDLASGRSLWRIDLPSAFRTDSGRGQTRRLESLEFSPAEPGREILVQAGRALGVYSARGQRLYEETKQVVFYAASARLRGDTDQVVCMLGEASTGPTTLVVLGPGGQVYWQRNDDRLALYNAASQIHLADLDGDGGEEIVTFDSETVSVFGFRG